MAIYGTLEEADEYLSGRLDAEAWLQASIDQKNRALQTATVQIDRHRFAGSKYDDDQELEFPRDDSPVDDAGTKVVPTAVEWACYEQALYLLGPSAAQHKARREAVEQGVAAVSVGDVSESYVGREVSELCATAKKLLKPFLLRVGKIV